MSIKPKVSRHRVRRLNVGNVIFAPLVRRVQGKPLGSAQDPPQASVSVSLLLALLVLAALLFVVGCGDGPTRQDRQWARSLVSPGEVEQEMAFDTSDPDRRREGVLRLSRRRSCLTGEYLEAYALLAKDPDPSVRSAAMIALGRAADPEYVPVLLAAEEDPAWMVRLDAADALDNSFTPEAAEPMRTWAAREPHPYVRARLLRALHHDRTSDTLDALVAAIDDPDYGVRRAARETLREMTGEDGNYDSEAWKLRLAEKDDPFARPKKSFWAWLTS